ncbi:MAG: hypothetical protein LQ352_008381 [Teloschistes flavicans]|nr:MAG: hypothetical protein LQ352_008381 [Teloschistes flavicans]
MIFMDAAAQAAGWLSFLATAVGLGSLITQTSAIEERLDPFIHSRGREYLGSWVSRQPAYPWYKVKKPRPVGPVIFTRLVDGFCGPNAIEVTRLPAGRPGKATWTAVLTIFHKPGPHPFHTGKAGDLKTSLTVQSSQSDVEKGPFAHDTEQRTFTSSEPGGWLSLKTQPLVRHGATACITISRTSLITILLLVNGRQMFRYSDASGHRASYASYCGHFYINWPLDGAATISFSPHDSHMISTDVYPPRFPVRVDRCVQMAAGIVCSPDSKFQCAFAGRKEPGNWILEYQPKGFPGAHGSRHLWNLMGGEVYKVDFLLAHRQEGRTDGVWLELPSKEPHRTWSLLVPPGEEEDVLLHALDCLPWSSMSWSIHRGLRDILVAYAKPTMNKYRASLAAKLRSKVLDHPSTLIQNGWNREFVHGSMGDIAANSVMAGEGNSGDSVRVVTAAAALLLRESDADDGLLLDETTFWRDRGSRYHTDQEQGGGPPDELTTAGVIALTKVFVLEWSVEFDYQMYHDLPPELLFR